MSTWEPFRVNDDEQVLVRYGRERLQDGSVEMSLAGPSAYVLDAKVSGHHLLLKVFPKEPWYHHAKYIWLWGTLGVLMMSILNDRLLQWSTLWSIFILFLLGCMLVFSERSAFWFSRKRALKRFNKKYPVGTQA